MVDTPFVIVGFDSRVAIFDLRFRVTISEKNTRHTGIMSAADEACE